MQEALGRCLPAWAYAGGTAGGPQAGEAGRSRIRGSPGASFSQIPRPTGGPAEGDSQNPHFPCTAGPPAAQMETV
jgi:hypothetical protein